MNIIYYNTHSLDLLVREIWTIHHIIVTLSQHSQYKYCEWHKSHSHETSH